MDLVLLLGVEISWFSLGVCFSEFGIQFVTARSFGSTCIKVFCRGDIVQLHNESLTPKALLWLKWPFVFWACCYELQMYVDFWKLFEGVDMDHSLLVGRCM